MPVRDGNVGFLQLTLAIFAPLAKPHLLPLPYARHHTAIFGVSLWLVVPNTARAPHSGPPL